MLLKVGVNFEPDRLLLYALRETQEVCDILGVQFIITSMRDREHSPGSKHYVGQAFDMRKKHMNRSQVTSLLAQLEMKIGDLYDIVEETTHIHIEVR